MLAPVAAAIVLAVCLKSWNRNPSGTSTASLAALHFGCQLPRASGAPFSPTEHESVRVGVDVAGEVIFEDGYEVSVEESIQETLASTRLEGFEPTPELLTDIELLRSGEIDHDELVERTLARYRPD